MKDELFSGFSSFLFNSLEVTKWIGIRLITCLVANSCFVKIVSPPPHFCKRVIRNAHLQPSFAQKQVTENGEKKFLGKSSKRQFFSAENAQFGRENDG